jgi:hypothetical protein
MKEFFYQMDRISKHQFWWLRKVIWIKEKHKRRGSCYSDQTRCRFPNAGRGRCLDEMTINGIKRYAMVDISEAEVSFIKATEGAQAPLQRLHR